MKGKKTRPTCSRDVFAEGFGEMFAGHVRGKAWKRVLKHAPTRCDTCSRLSANTSANTSETSSRRGAGPLEARADAVAARMSYQK